MWNVVLTTISIFHRENFSLWSSKKVAKNPICYDADAFLKWSLLLYYEVNSALVYNSNLYCAWDEPLCTSF